MTRPHGQAVATFSAPLDLALDEIWHGRRTNDVTSDGQQGNPLGRPGYGLEHEPLDQEERDSDHTVQRAASFADTARVVRSALRPGAVL